MALLIGGWDGRVPVRSGGRPRPWRRGAAGAVTDRTLIGSSGEGVDTARTGGTNLEHESFERRFEAIFAGEFPRLFRLLDRLTGDADVASDLAQEALVRLYRRGSEPDRPEAWLVSVALNLLRNHRSTAARRSARLTRARGADVQGDPPASPLDRLVRDEAGGRAREALSALDERERRMLLLHSAGYSYREIADALELHEPSVGTLLARARRAFRTAFTGALHAH